MRLSLGCGQKRIEDTIGLDNIFYGWNTIWDAGNAIPFEDNEIDFIECHNFLEHIRRELWQSVFNECWRILKPDGQMEIVVPNAERSLGLALADPTHLSLWVNGTLKYLRGERPRNSDIGFKHWEVLKNEPYEKEARDDYIILKPKK